MKSTRPRQPIGGRHSGCALAAGGYGDTMPPPILGACSEPFVDGAPDLRGLWEVVAVEVDGAIVPDHPAWAIGSASSSAAIAWW